MKRFAVVLLVAMLSLVLLFAPAVLEARGGRGGGGGGKGGFHGGSRGGHYGGNHGGYHGGYHGGHHGAPGNGGRFFGYVPFLGFGAGFLAGYWLDGYYYTNPYYGVCQRWIPTGDYYMESRQDPDTGAWEEVQVPGGYWEVIPCN